MELEHISDLPARSVYVSSGDEVEIPAGKTLKIETSPRGQDILEVEVPAGKVWTVRFNLVVDESDA